MDHHPGTRRGTRARSGRDCDGLWDWNLTSNRIHFSPGWVSLVGYERQEVGNNPEDWFQRVHPEDSERLRRQIEALRSDGNCDFDLRYRLRHKNGTYRWMSSRGLVVRNDAGEAIRLTGSQSDITVETVSDPLTGLPNQLLLHDRLAHAIDGTRRHPTLHFALLLIELGRSPGARRASGSTGRDPLLNASARRLETWLRLPEMTPGRRQSDLVARVEGELFALLLDGLEQLADAQVVAERMLEKLLAPFTVGGHEVRLTPAIGIAVSATGYAQPDEALRDARAALHRARILGGSHVEVFDAGTLQSTQLDLQLEGDLDAALQRQELQLVYQPIVSIATNRIVGFEALVRWQHPTLGTVAPDDFIPIAERTGFIVPLGNWVLREACRQMRAWQTDIPAATDVWMSVNLTNAQSRQPDLIDHIGAALRDSALPAGSLVLELTEGTAMENPAAVTTLLMQLRAMGIRISIDDFGTGYSSLAYLHQFPVDALKIDRSFVRRLDIDHDTVAIVGGMVAMAQRLGLHVVAEGVEHENQLALLRTLQCESVQGYLFARPIGVDAATELLQTGLPAPQERSGQEPAGAGPRRGVATRPTGVVPPARAPWLAGAAVVAVVMCVGAVALYEADGPAANADLDMSVGNAAEEPTEEPALSGDPVAEPDPVVSPRADAPLTAAAPAAAPPRPSPAPATFSVVHLHRLGSCRGRLTVSRDGITYVPDDEHGNDAFTLRHTEFLHTLDRATLTIRSPQRTYRFEAGSSADARGSDVASIGEAIARFQPR